MTRTETWQELAAVAGLSQAGFNLGFPTSHCSDGQSIPSAARSRNGAAAALAMQGLAVSCPLLSPLGGGGFGMAWCSKVLSPTHRTIPAPGRRETSPPEPAWAGEVSLTQPSERSRGCCRVKPRWQGGSPLPPPHLSCRDHAALRAAEAEGAGGTEHPLLCGGTETLRASPWGPAI